MANRNALILALLGVVLLGHGVVLDWLAQQAHEQAALRLMTVPMFTRLLQPKAPPSVPKPPSAVATVRPRRSTPVIQSIANSTPPEATPTVLPPQPLSDVEMAMPATPPPAEPASPAVASLPAQATATSAAPAASEPLAPTLTATVTPSNTLTATPTASVAAGAGSVASLDSWPTDTRLSYKLGGYYRGELHGTARVQWQRESARYQVRIDIDLGVITQVMTSQGEVTPQSLAPLAYEESRTGKRRSVQLQEKRIVLADGKELPRPPGVQDTASQFVELSHRFSSGQMPLEVGRAVSFSMARPGGVDEWTYDVVGKDLLQTPQLGAVEAFHLKPRPLANPRGNITAEMWFAPSLQYLPVRIRVTLGDANVDLLVDRIEQR